MALLADLDKAIECYANDNCKLEIDHFQIISAPSGQTNLNVGESFAFRVKISNNGPLDMKGVKIRVMGSSFANVAMIPGFPNIPSVTPPFDLDAHQSYLTGFFTGQALASTTGKQAILTALIDSWDASLDYLLKDQTRGGGEVKCNQTIMPT